MSMIGSFFAIDNDRLRLLLESPDSIEEFIEAAMEDEGSVVCCDVDKAWHAIHFILNGHPEKGEEPLNFVVLGGTAFGDDLGYGPPRFLLPGQVQAVAQALDPITPDEFAAELSLSALAAAEIYPQLWDNHLESYEYVLSYYEDLRLFYLAAAERNDAVIFLLS